MFVSYNLFSKEACLLLACGSMSWHPADWPEVIMEVAQNSTYDVVYESEALSIIEDSY